MTTPYHPDSPNDNDNDNHDDTFPVVPTKGQTKSQYKRHQRQITMTTLDRLTSILYDVETFVRPMIQQLQQQLQQRKHSRYHVHVLANERCGSWYTQGLRQHYNNNDDDDDDDDDSNDTSSIRFSWDSCYFKSTDGHVDIYNVSWKRLNWNVLELFVNNSNNVVVIVDSSIRKCLSDALSKTIPLWVTTMNRLATLYRPSHDDAPTFWDDTLYTPSFMISEKEQARMEHSLQDSVGSLYQSGVILPYHQELLATLTKPLKCVWMTPENRDMDTIFTTTPNNEKYHIIVCCNASSVKNRKHPRKRIFQLPTTTNLSTNETPKELSFTYVPGAADDQESWARHLTPTLFWKHATQLVCTGPDDLHQVIDDLVQHHRSTHDSWELDPTTSCDVVSSGSADCLGKLGLWVGSRRASRPPECWKHFSAILNVTTEEYPTIKASVDEMTDRNRWYLQMPVAEGKRDKTCLERWLPVGLVFLIQQVQRIVRQPPQDAIPRGDGILLHCAQGKDRSVAVAMAMVALFCPVDKFPLEWDTEAISKLSLDRLQTLAQSKTTEFGQVDHDNDTELYLQSGLSNSLVQVLSDPVMGHTLFLQWLHIELDRPLSQPFANKESLRVVFQMVRQDRCVANPNRKTLQKLHRFFLSHPMYRDDS